MFASRSSRLTLVAIALAAFAACATGRYGPSRSTEVTKSPRPIDELSVKEREAILARAQVWQPVDTAKLDLMAGPKVAGAFAHDADVVCDYQYPDKPLSGVTPKFECKVGPDDVVKVKFGEENGEVYAEVAASRLFWALGFAADRMYPVRVTCRNCPEDPFRESKAEWHLGRSGKVSTKRFEVAVIERDYPGEEVEVPRFEGWAWPELDLVSEKAGGAPRAQVDALKLLAVFIQHVDSKPEQQAIVCPEKQLGKDAEGDATCRRPMLVVKDLGTAFGKGKPMFFSKMRLDVWKDVPIWKEPEACVGDLTRSIVGSLSHPRISEPGRKFLADRLQRLSDRQIRDLFAASRVEKRGETIRDASGTERPVTVDDWVEVFKAKRAQIVDHRCPA